MAFPNIIYGRYGDEKKVSGTKVLELGQRMQLPDGQIYAYAQCSSTAALAVSLVVTAKAVHFADSALLATASKGATTVVVTFGATAAAVPANLYEDGTLYAYKGAVAPGLKYKIKSHGTAGAATALTVNLQAKDKVHVTMTASTVMLRENPFKYVLLSAGATAEVGIVAGVPAASCAVSDYIWLQRRGECLVKTAATIGVVGTPVVLAAGTAGNVSRWIAAADTSTNQGPIGTFVSSVTTAADYGLIYLTLD